MSEMTLYFIICMQWLAIFYVGWFMRKLNAHYKANLLYNMEIYGFFEIDDKTILATEIYSTRVREVIVKGLHDEAFEKKETP